MPRTMVCAKEAANKQTSLEDVARARVVTALGATTWSRKKVTWHKMLWEPRYANPEAVL